MSDYCHFAACTTAPALRSFCWVSAHRGEWWDQGERPTAARPLQWWRTSAQPPHTLEGSLSSGCPRNLMSGMWVPPNGM